jgi:Divergent InlB B-repeat domain
LWDFRYLNIARRKPRFGSACQAPPSFQLSVSFTGQGEILSDPPYIDCEPTCSAPVPADSYVTLHLQPLPGWSAVPPGETAACPLQFDAPAEPPFIRVVADTVCSIVFEPVAQPTTLAVSINGAGRVVSEPEGIDCPGNCTETYPVPRAGNAFAAVGLSATPNPGYRFASFSGDPACNGSSFVMDVSRRCDALFVALPTPSAPTGLAAAPAQPNGVQLNWNAVTDDSVISYTLERADGNGAFQVIYENLRGDVGSVTDVNAIGGRDYTYRLSASNASGTSPPATVTITLAAPGSVILTVQVTGEGSVTSAPSGIDCGTDCSEGYPFNTDVTLTAAATTSSRFDGWIGDCAGTSPVAMVALDANKTCTAQFGAVGTGGWQIVAANIASSKVTDLQSSLVLDASGQAYVAYLQRVGTQSRLTVRREGTGQFIPLGGALNANASWSATGADLVLDANGTPFMVFNMDLDANDVVRWDGTQWLTVNSRLNLTSNTGSRPRIARAGNTLVAAWIESARIAVRRYHLDTQQWDAGSYTPEPNAGAINGPLDIDLAVDSNGLAVIAYSAGATGGVLRAQRETSPGTWVNMGGDIGVRPATGPMVRELGVHVDANDVARVAWVEGDTEYFVSLAQFDGTNWVALPGRAGLQFLQSTQPVRSLSVNRSGPLFAFAYSVDANAQESDVVVQQLGAGGLTSVGTTFSTRHPQVGDLSLAMSAADSATLAESEFTPADTVEPYKLAIRRVAPFAP